MRRPRSLLVGRVSQADVEAEAYARFVGSWGNFSAPIGQRWEQLAGAWAQTRIGGSLPSGEGAYTLLHIEALDHNIELHREVERVGVSCPDALFCGRDSAGRVVIQPVDYKVSLDTAGFDQVEAERILDLATRGGQHTVRAIWNAALLVGGEPADTGVDEREGLLERLHAEAICPIDGLFVSPDTAFNRVHLRSSYNRQRQHPLRPVDVLLVAATPEQFFGGLAGWQEAQLLLQADRVRADLPGDLGMAEHYARLGAGAAGAMHMLHSPLFGPAEPLDTAGELRRLLTTHPTSVQVLTVLQQRRAERLELLRRRDKLLNLPFRMPALVEALGPVPNSGSDALWPADVLRTGITALHAAHRARVSEEGANLTTLGWDDERVLSELEQDLPAFRRAARADLDRWAANEQGRAATQTPT